MTMELTHQELDGGLQARAVGSPGGSRSLLSAFRLFAFLKRSKLKKEKKRGKKEKKEIYSPVPQMWDLSMHSWVIEDVSLGPICSANERSYQSSRGTRIQASAFCFFPAWVSVVPE